jgi:hypothetical protein
MARHAPLTAALFVTLGALYVGCTQDFGAFEPIGGEGGNGSTSSTTVTTGSGITCTSDNQCDDLVTCTTDTCNGGECQFSPLPDGPVPGDTDFQGDCIDKRCNSGVIENVADDSETPDDGNDCTTDSCQNGAPVSTNVPAGTACAAGVCNDMGQCTGCNDPGDCGGMDTFCAAHTCENSICGISNTADGTPWPAADQTDFDCTRIECDGNGGTKDTIDDTDLPDDGDLCTADVCDNGVASNPQEPAGTDCGNGDVCNNAGNCVECATNAQCTPPDTCGAIDPFQCGCSPNSKNITCNAKCGATTGNCGQVEDCGGCNGPGSPVCFQNSCCVPQTLAITCAGKNCGMTQNNCGQTVTCQPNSCIAPQTCGGGGTPNVCGCSDNGMACLNKDCGSVTNNCGVMVSCGPACVAPQTCGGGGTANVCGP